MVHKFKILSYKGTVKRMLPKAPHWLLAFVHIAGRLIIRIPGPKGNRFSLEQKRVFGDDTDRLWEEVKHRFGIATARTSAYLNWRHKDQGANFFFAHGKGQVAGYVILKLEENSDGIKVGKILDILYEENTAAEFLLSSSLRYFWDQGADCVLCGCIPGNPLEIQLDKAGFGYRKGLEPFPVVWLPFSDDLDKAYISDPGNWHLLYGDIDGF